MRSSIRILFIALIAAMPAIAEDPKPANADPGVWDQVMEMYELAKETGERVPKDVYEWVREDIESFGAWEYRVLQVAKSDLGIVEEQLNEMGAERWECIQVETIGTTTWLYMKRPVKSYLRNLPLSQLLKVIGGAGGGD